MYDIYEDPNEYINIASQQPALFAQMHTRMNQYQAGVLNPYRGEIDPDTAEVAEICGSRTELEKYVSIGLSNADLGQAQALATQCRLYAHPPQSHWQRTGCYKAQRGGGEKFTTGR